MTPHGAKKLAVVGAGFWAQNQLAAWQELEKEDLVEFHSISDLDRSKAEQAAAKFGFEQIFTNPEEMFHAGGFDFVDVITTIESHKLLVLMAVENEVPVICQKPLAPTLADALEMTTAAERANVPFFVHENWRWQHPLRAVKQRISQGDVGKIIAVELKVIAGSFDHYQNQPYLAELERYIVSDLGIHLIDTARFLSDSDVRRVYAQLQKYKSDIAGEDYARLLLTMESGVQVNAELSLGPVLENERFPQTFATVIGTAGSVELGPDFRIAFTTKENWKLRTDVAWVDVPHYEWAHPKYAVAVVSMVEANRNFLDALNSVAPCETTARDNLNVLATVFGSYLSSEKETLVRVDDLAVLDRELQNGNINIK